MSRDPHHLPSRARTVPPERVLELYGMTPDARYTPEVMDRAGCDGVPMPVALYAQLKVSSVAGVPARYEPMVAVPIMWPLTAEARGVPGLAGVQRLAEYVLDEDRHDAVAAHRQRRDRVDTRARRGARRKGRRGHDLDVPLERLLQVLIMVARWTGGISVRRADEAVVRAAADLAAAIVGTVDPVLVEQGAITVDDMTMRDDWDELRLAVRRRARMHVQRVSRAHRPRNLRR